MPQIEREIETSVPGVQPEAFDVPTSVANPIAATSAATLLPIEPSAVDPLTADQRVPPIPTRVSPYPLRTRQPKRQWESLQSITTKDEF